MAPGENSRIDKYLWAVRIFKSRSGAAEACKKVRIFINGTPAKPSKSIAVKDIIIVKKLPATFTYEVAGIPASRVSASLVQRYITDLTPEEEKSKMSTVHSRNSGRRPKGTGRPTKKERREIDRLFKSSSAGF